MSSNEYIFVDQIPFAENLMKPHSKVVYPKCIPIPITQKQGFVNLEISYILKIGLGHDYHP